ncbi:AraC family transcriptional regulator [Roseixanthobacter pseudopolyaromaticivorans]|uniref:AraC family transcriptional regulator n=1 Tax=Xanthobacteraceae TaxID=335928 RepID=UPI0037266E0E
MDPIVELRTLIIRHAGQQATPRALPDIVLAVADSLSEPRGHSPGPTFALVAQGAKRAVLGDKVFDYAAGQYLIVALELPLVASLTRASRDEPFLGFGLILDPLAVAELLLEAGLDEPRGAPPGIAVSTAGDDLLEPIVRLLRLLDRPSDLPILAPAIRREILWRLINGAQGAMIRQLGLADSHIRQISRAVRWIRDHHAETLRIDELARLANMSQTSFFRHFRTVTSLTPIQYQKQVRLQEARTRLLANPGDVASVGHAVGYESPSQFSREYRRLFGAPPGRDVAQLMDTLKSPNTN